MAYLQQVGAQAVLIGEHFMRQPIVEQAVHDLMGTHGPKGEVVEGERGEFDGCGDGSNGKNLWTSKR